MLWAPAADNFTFRAFPSPRMTIAALISLRETFEASLVICVVLAFLQRIKRNDFTPAVWLGVASGVAVSIGVAAVLTAFSQSLPAESLELYEGFMLLAAAALLLWMISWMAGTGRTMKSDIERTAAAHVQGESFLGIFFISFAAAAREGVEMALMVHATLIGTGKALHTMAGVGLGIVGALLIAALLIRGIRFIPMRIFFTVTTVLLILLGSSLMLKSIEELSEGFGHSEVASSLPLVAATVYAGGALLLWRKRVTNG